MIILEGVRPSMTAGLDLQNSPSCLSWNSVFSSLLSQFKLSSKRDMCWKAVLARERTAQKVAGLQYIRHKNTTTTLLFKCACVRVSVWQQRLSRFIKNGRQCPGAGVVTVVFALICLWFEGSWWKKRKSGRKELTQNQTRKCEMCLESQRGSQASFQLERKQ